ncbi:MAG TPA: HPF/RaiA family ribosome-associated protein [Kofleriaceae bacterium]|nr:HPF/RaiA family ribosome-associated protein [Kofleriaceae bacterium]
MSVSTHVTFHQLDHSDGIEAAIREHADRLEHLGERIERCDVVIERPHRSQREGLPFHVRIHLHVPGNDVIIDRDPGLNEAHTDPYVAIHDAFHAARRRLEDHIRTRRGEVKAHSLPPT